jgi:hypothetical protein
MDTDIKSISLGLICIKHDYIYNELNDYNDCSHTCIITNKDGSIKYVKLDGSYIFNNYFHLLSNRDKEHFHHLITKKQINKIAEIIDDSDITKLSRSYLEDDKKTCCYVCWSCLC